MKTRLLAAAVLIGMSIASLGCTSPGKETEPDKVTVQLKWVHQAQFAGFYLAKEKGFYADENLAVEFIEGGQGVDTTEALISGRADFAVMAPEDLLIKRSAGAPITAIAAIYRRSAVVFVSRAGSGIDRPFDFVEKTVAVTGGTGAIRDFEIQFNALVRRLGIDKSRIRRLPYEPSYRGFIDGKVDVTPAYITGGVVRIQKSGQKAHIIWPGDYGIRFYSDTLVAGNRIIEGRPDVVTRFLRATLKGWRDAVGDTKDAVAATLKYARIKDPAIQAAMMEAQMPLVHTGEHRIGWMSGSQWQEMVRILAAEKVLSPPLPEIDKVYTMRFVESAYGGES